MALTRRRILTGSALAFSSAGASIRLPRKVRLGLLDLEGHVGEILTPLPQVPDVEVTAMAHPSVDAVARQKKNPRLAAAKHYTDWRRMLDSEPLDAVAVCNPNGPRAEAILACLDRKLHVIAEKPIALNRADLDKIRTAASKAGVRVSTLLPMRFSSVYLAVKQIVASGEIGEVINISAQKSYKAGERAEWMKRRKTYGGTIPWIGIHMIDLMRFTSGIEFKEVFSWQAQIGAPAGIGEMENTTGSVFRMANEGVAVLHMDYCRPETAQTHGDDRLRLAGTKGVVEYQAATGVTVMSAARKPEVIQELPAAQSVLIDFLQQAFNGRPAALSFEDVYRSNLATIAAQEAAESGRPRRV